MDSKIKERIIGAAVLVALGVWLIPWVLNGSDPPATETDIVEEDTLLPAADDTGIRSETVVLEPASGDRREQVDEPDPPDEAPTVISVGTVATDNDTLEPVADPELTVADTSSNAAVESPAAQIAAADPAAEDWSVQLGAFGEQANAEQLARRVSDFGFDAVVSDYRSGGRAMHRVRVRGFASRELAEVAASSLDAHGFPTRVVSSAE